MMKFRNVHVVGWRELSRHVVHGDASWARNRGICLRGGVLRRMVLVFRVDPSLSAFPLKNLPDVFQIGEGALPCISSRSFMHLQIRSFCLRFTLVIRMQNLNFSRSLPPTSLPFSCSFLAGRFGVGSPTPNTRTCEHLCAHTLRQVFRGSSRLRNVLFC
jgi:hypothetical protein